MKEHRSEHAIILVREEYQSWTHGKEPEIPSQNVLNGMNRCAYDNHAECCRWEMCQRFCQSIIAHRVHELFVAAVAAAAAAADVGCGGFVSSIR